ncbi:glycosyl hydrolase family 28-related protein [Paracidobacterium acidisoli]|uniref:glycosyl hydrolase family 28-related protein n=1 Tax=Paracidobacterium acidisoli TaxID=2303751 RepID=UPI0018F227CE|nr:glycoside hydrolase family 55 protein [Paracidobacterium acidisoli]
MLICEAGRAQQAASAQAAPQAAEPNAIQAHGVEGNWRVNGLQTAGNTISKLPRVDVRHPDFGQAAGCPNAADAKGVNDSTCAIRAAIAFANTAGVSGSSYPVVYLPAGTYRVSDFLHVSCNLTVEGDGESATVIELTNDTGSGLIAFSRNNPDGLNDGGQCYGGLRDLTVRAKDGHLFTGALVEIANAAGYSFHRVRLDNSGGYGLKAMAAERVFADQLTIDNTRWPLVGPGNEGHFIKLNINGPGRTSDGYCWGANCVDGRDIAAYAGRMMLRSASGNGTTATFVVSCEPAAQCPGGGAGISPVVAGHHFRVSGISDMAALNGYYTVASVKNNTPAGAFTVTAASRASGKANGLSAAKWQPAALPETHAAVTAEGFDVAFYGGSIKATRNAGCFQVVGSQVVTVQNFYCEAAPYNGIAAVSPDVILNGQLPYTLLTSAFTGTACVSNASDTCTAGVAGGSANGTMWMENVAGMEQDIAGYGVNLILYPPDYDPTQATESSMGQGVLRNQYERLVGAFFEGRLYGWYRQGISESGRKVFPAWPAHSYLQRDNTLSFGPQFTSIANHFESDDGPGANWAAYCNDNTDIDGNRNSSLDTCASVIAGVQPDGVLVFPPGYAAGMPKRGSVNAEFINTELNGAAPASVYESTGVGYIKVHTAGSIVISGQFSQQKAETNEVSSGQVTTASTPVVAVQYNNGHAASINYVNTTTGTRLIGTNFSNTQYDKWYESNLFYDLSLDPVLSGGNPGLGFPAGHQFSTSDCWYDVPAGSEPTAHAENSWCAMGGPGLTGTKAGWTYRIWNASAKRWVDAFRISNNGNNAADVEITGTLKVNGGAASAAQTSVAGSNGGDSPAWNNGGAPIAPHSCVAGPSASVGSAAAGMEISVTPAANPGLGLTWNNAWPENGRTVQAEVCNVTAAPIVPRAAAYHFRVSR